MSKICINSSIYHVWDIKIWKGLIYLYSKCSLLETLELGGSKEKLLSEYPAVIEESVLSRGLTSRWKVSASLLSLHVTTHQTNNFFNHHPTIIFNPTSPSQTCHINSRPKRIIFFNRGQQRATKEWQIRVS